MFERVFPSFEAYETAVAHYEIVVNNIPVTVETKPGQTLDFQVERIDVDDVEITTETGAKRKVRGSYQLFRQVGASWSQVEIADRKSGCENIMSTNYATFPTQTGIDVPAGSYKVVVTYDTEEQARKSKEYLVSVP